MAHTDCKTGIPFCYSSLIKLANLIAPKSVAPPAMPVVEHLYTPTHGTYETTNYAAPRRHTRFYDKLCSSAHGIITPNTWQVANSRFHSEHIISETRYQINCSHAVELFAVAYGTLSLAGSGTDSESRLDLNVHSLKVTRPFLLLADGRFRLLPAPGL